MARKTGQTETFLCESCGDSFPKWFGRCPSCGEWNTLVSFRVPSPLPSAGRRSRKVGAPERGLGIPGRPKRAGGSIGEGQSSWVHGQRDPGFEAGVQILAEVPADGPQRILSGIGEFDRVLGGGIVPGSVILIGGDPGVGKSTLLLQIAARLVESGCGVLYASGEESATQTKLRAQRLGITGQLSLLAETDLERIIEAVGEGVIGSSGSSTPSLVNVLIVDSIQSAFLPDLPSAPGSVLQVREGALALTQMAKTKQVAVLLIGHVTKEGNLAGPRTLEHIVDVVLTMEGDRFQAHRILRSVKNRFGSVHEIGVFDMREDGLQEVTNPSRLFLGEGAGHTSGSVVVAGIEGTRSLLMEVQALVHSTRYGIPQRIATGFDGRRLAILLAVLTRRGGVDVASSDVFVNVAGGLRVDEPGVDLGILLAIASSLLDRPVGEDMAVFGEMGLGGEVRRTSHPERRIAEAARLGFRRIAIPVATSRDLEKRRWQCPHDCRLLPVATLRDALAVAIEKKERQSEMGER
ncbi:MAG: DNA repair protein RadA [Candidatus Eisenbacteria sp.]|nr:DNA repair protein RadA [Candidatus Eisenbacteria bacterium]